MDMGSTGDGEADIGHSEESGPGETAGWPEDGTDFDPEDEVYDEPMREEMSFQEEEEEEAYRLTELYNALGELEGSNEQTQ